jgi:hypothetical protein
MQRLLKKLDERSPGIHQTSFSNFNHSRTFFIKFIKQIDSRQTNFVTLNTLCRSV